MKETKKKSLILAFLVPLVFLGAWMLLLGIAPFGERTFLLHDMKRQYSAFYAEYRRILLGEGGLFYSLHRGLGGSTAELFAYYLSSPFLFLLLLFPAEYFPEAISLILVLKAATAGLTFYVFLDYILIRKSVPGECSASDSGSAAAILIACSTSFALGTFMIANMTNTMWTDAIILMPLLYLSVIRLFEGKNPLPCAILTGLVLYANYYFAFMIFLFETVAVAVHLPLIIRKNRIRLLPRWIFMSVLGAGLASFMILPAFFPLLDTAGGRFALGETGLLTGLSAAEIMSKLFSLSFDSLQVFEGSPHLFAGTLLLLPALLYFSDASFEVRERIRSAALLLILFVSFLVRPLDLLWHAGTEPSGYLYRYAFLFVFLMVTVAARELLQLSRAAGATGVSSRPAAQTVCRILLTSLLLLAAGAYVLTRRFSYLTTGKMLFNLALVMVSSVAAVLVFFRKRPLRSTVSAALAAALLLIHLADLGLNATNVFLQEDLQGMTRSGYREAFEQFRLPLEAVSEEEKADKAVRRTESVRHVEQNDPLLFGYSGTTYYSSDIKEEVKFFLHRLGYPFNEYSYWYRADNTASASALLGITRLIGDDTAVEQRPALPMALRIPADASGADPSAADDPFSFTESVFRAVSGRPVSLFHRADIAAPAISEESTEGQNTCTRYDFRITPSADGTLYLSLSDDILSGDSLSDAFEPRNLTVQTDGLPEQPYANYENNHVLNLGTHESGSELVFTIRVYDGLPLEQAPVAVTEDESALAGLLDELSADGCAGYVIRPSHRDSSVLHVLLPEEGPADSDCLILLPYSEEWTFRLEDRKLQAEPFCGLYTRIRLPSEVSGESIRIGMKYIPKGFAGGLILSAAAFLILLLLYLRRDF